MPEEQLSAEEELKKATWGYIGVSVLWLSLIISGMALERLDLTSGYLTSLLPAPSTPCGPRTPHSTNRYAN